MECAVCLGCMAFINQPATRFDGIKEIEEIEQEKGKCEGNLGLLPSLRKHRCRNHQQITDKKNGQIPFHSGSLRCQQAVPASLSSGKPAHEPDAECRQHKRCAQDGPQANLMVNRLGGTTGNDGYKWNDRFRHCCAHSCEDGAGYPFRHPHPLTQVFQRIGKHLCCKKHNNQSYNQTYDTFHQTLTKLKKISHL